MAKKRCYKKPEIKQVKLTPEEAVITACKATGNEGAKHGTGCANPNQSCIDAGS